MTNFLMAEELFVPSVRGRCRPDESESQFELTYCDAL